MDDLEDLLKQPEYAKLRKCSERTIERERTSGTGCRYVKIGRAVRYRRRDILDFIDRHVRQSTSECTPMTAGGVDPALHGQREGRACHRDCATLGGKTLASAGSIERLVPELPKVGGRR